MMALAMLKRWSKKLAKLSPETIRRMIVLGLAAIFLAFFAKLALTVATSANGPTYDAAILQWIGKQRTAWLNIVATDVTSLGSTTIVTLLSVWGLILLLLTDDRQDAIHLVVAAIGSGVLTRVLKLTFERPRPRVIPQLVETSGFSFPSGHSLTSAAMYLTLAIIACRYVKATHKRTVVFAVCVSVIFLTAASRVYLGVHYPSDVLGGTLLGAAWALILGAAFSVYQRK